MRPITDLSDTLRKEGIPHELEQCVERGNVHMLRLYYPSRSNAIVELKYGESTYGSASDMIEIAFAPVEIDGVPYVRRHHCISMEAAHKLITFLYTELK